MATMTIRTTVAFDPATVARWERLARQWGTSKSETLRRALQAAEVQLSQQSGGNGGDHPPDFTGLSPMEIMNWLSEHPLAPGGLGESWSREIREERQAEASRSADREDT